MKWKLLFAMCFLALIFAIGCKKTGIPNKEEQKIVQSNKLTIEAVKSLAKKGDNLSWDDFKSYGGNEIGSGLYIMAYPINNKYELLIGGGSPQESPMYVNLFNKSTRKYIDIRHEDIDKFIK